MKRKELKELYDFVASEYIRKFQKKHGYEMDYWVADDIGGIASFIEQYFFSYSDIKYDIDENLSKGLIFQWQDDSLDDYFEQEEDDGGRNSERINLKSYVMGLRYEDIKKPPTSSETVPVVFFQGGSYGGGTANPKTSGAYFTGNPIKNGATTVSACSGGITNATIVNPNTPFTYTTKEVPAKKVRLTFHR